MVYLKFQNCLPLDLLSKGNIIFEVWDKDETSSDFLGGCELHLSDLLKKGKKLTRILAEGLGTGDTESERLPDGRPAAFQYKVSPKSVPWSQARLVSRERRRPKFLLMLVMRHQEFNNLMRFLIQLTSSLEMVSVSATMDFHFDGK